MHVRKGSTWKPRMLAAETLFWATSNRTILTDRFGDTRKIIKRIFRGQSEPAKTYRGFMKMLDKWHVRLLLTVVCELRLRMEQELTDQFQIAGFTVFAERRFGFERAASPEGNVQRDAGKLFNYSRCGFRGIRILEGDPRLQPRFRDSHRRIT